MLNIQEYSLLTFFVLLPFHPSSNPNFPSKNVTELAYHQFCVKNRTFFSFSSCQFTIRREYNVSTRFHTIIDTTNAHLFAANTDM